MPAPTRLPSRLWLAPRCRKYLPLLLLLCARLAAAQQTGTTGEPQQTPLDYPGVQVITIIAACIGLALVLVIICTLIIWCVGRHYQSPQGTYVEMVQLFTGELEFVASNVPSIEYDDAGRFQTNA